MFPNIWENKINVPNHQPDINPFPYVHHFSQDFSTCQVTRPRCRTARPLRDHLGEAALHDPWARRRALHHTGSWDHGARRSRDHLPGSGENCPRNNQIIWTYICICTYIYILIFIYLFIPMCIYIYTYREREMFFFLRGYYMVFGAHLINICLCDHLIIMVQRGVHIYIYNII